MLDRAFTLIHLRVVKVIRWTRFFLIRGIIAEACHWSKKKNMFVVATFRTMKKQNR